MIEMKDLIPLIVVVIPICIISIIMTVAFSAMLITEIKKGWDKKVKLSNSEIARLNNFKRLIP